MGLKIIILAAGKGKRMASDTPKVLHRIGGKSMLEHVVDTASELEPDNIYVIYGNGGSIVKEALNHLTVDWVFQEERLGTGHAVLQAMPFCKDQDQVLVLYGDVPLISLRLLKQLLQDTPPHGLGLVVTALEDPVGFGRIIRNDVGNIVAIVEHKDAADWQLEIKEINTGILTATAKKFKQWLPKLNNNNHQQEYYLTDSVAEAVSQGVPVGGIMAYNPKEVLGVNDRWQQAKLERYYQYISAKKLARTGVCIADFGRIDIRGDISIGRDTFIDVNVVLEGKVRIGKHCKIGPNVFLKDAIVGDHVEILANTVVEGANIQQHATIGPFAHLRHDTLIGESAKVGNFVEMKKTSLGAGSKANHLSYLGDAVVGANVNIGAGTITCNYDGINKHTTVIKDNAFIGSNASLVAPLTVGMNSTIAAGSTITLSTPDGALVVAREKQRVIEHWKRSEKKEKLNN